MPRNQLFLGPLLESVTRPNQLFLFLRHVVTEIHKNLEVSVSLSIEAYFDLKWNGTTSCALRQKLHAKVALDSFALLLLSV